MPLSCKVSIHAPVRVRPGASTALTLTKRFNPRTREGATSYVALAWMTSSSFNPRTREGATIIPRENLPEALSFNPRTREGATEPYETEDGFLVVSIHAPVRVRRPEAQGLKVRGPNGVLRQPVQSSCALQVVMMSGSFVNLRASMTYRVRQFPGDFL